jgi:GT2 family glycosyltransferase
VQEQDIPITLLTVDNGSTDGSQHYRPGMVVNLEKNYGVSKGWNVGIDLLFSIQLMGGQAYQHVLVIGNDTVLPSWLYRVLLSYNAPFVTGVAVDQMEQIQVPEPTYAPLSPNPDFSCFLIRRECWEEVGPFDERMVHYCSDCDMHIRAHRAGIPLMKGCVPYYHERSSTLRRASPEERIEIETQANKDRAVFKSIYGCLPGDKAYEAIFL